MTNELTQKQITSNVATRIEAMKGEGLLIAPNYSVSNALSSAYYALKNAPGGNLLEKCTPESVYNALLDMVTQGLSPAKTQCYFIPYGNTVKLTRSYFGTMKVVKQLPEVKDIVQNNFPQEMAKRTVINRAAKQFFNTSDDNDLFIDAVNRTTENEYDNGRQMKEAEPVKEEVETLDDILKAPSTPTEPDNVIEGEFTAETKTPPKTAEKTANDGELTSTEYPEDEIPDFDEVTGEVLEEISLFEGNTINVKE